MTLGFQPNEALFRSPMVDRLVDITLEEDLGHGDATTEALGLTGTGRAQVVAEQPLICCGGPLVARLVARSGFPVELSRPIPEGSRVAQGDPLVQLTGPVHALLALEQIVVNLVARQSGVATVARQYADAVGDTCRVVDTRQTLPGWRLLDRYAVGVGGAGNHRYDLGSGLLIRRSHIEASGSVSSAVKRVRRWAPHTLRVGVEVSMLSQLYEALEAGAEVVVLSGMTPEQSHEVVARVEARALVEVSGDISLERAKAYAEAGVDVVSVRALTADAGLARLSFALELLPDHE